MKIIFLDIDGVLNSENFFESHPSGENQLRSGPRENCIDKRAVEKLNLIIRETDADLVISSTWRVKGLDKCNGYLLFAGCKKPAIGVTAMRMRADRVAEILEWKNHYAQQIESWIAIDDEDISILGDHAVMTSISDGLQDCHVSEAISKLNGT